MDWVTVMCFVKVFAWPVSLAFFVGVIDGVAQYDERKRRSAAVDEWIASKRDPDKLKAFMAPGLDEVMRKHGIDPVPSRAWI